MSLINKKLNFKEKNVLKANKKKSGWSTFETLIYLIRFLDIFLILKKYIILFIFLNKKLI